MIGEVIEGVSSFGLMVIVYVLGMSRERARKPKPPPPPPEPNLHCDCGHALAFHTGIDACKHIESRMVYTKNGSPMKKEGEYVRENLPCNCQQYTGDLPADWYVRTGMPS